MVERRLGRGLDFFLSGSSGAAEPAGESVTHVEVGRLRPGAHQPRRHFADEELDELAASIRASGVLQPILVRKRGEQLEIVAGERRWRAAQRAGLERIPALVREVTDEMAAVLGLVENIQRQDLNPLEKARAFERIVKLTQSKQEDVARQVGLSRSAVANFMRLLELPSAVQEHVSRGTLSMGHARALLALKDHEEMTAVADDVVRRGLSVREVEALMQELGSKAPTSKADSTANPAQGSQGGGGKPKSRPVWLNEIEENLAEALGTAVAVRYGRKRSRITIECIGREEFERVYELLKGLAKD